ncbi:aminotransferase class I/II-fold pyridoxal phosphate-dependent enzyme [Sutcliffiella horikoshii]|uniref:Aminotransferase class I/II-fold pyridoxal phosphate-dependent enzyme n=1 Tax=Sutcliffiella horikoshii TaxID=79883 RepID=A0A5D4SVH3_9BACI|nr:aminotransferase class I/II-fold pyridoxal phosphate-dependent enzyme [Sutcliffiella horikoshii]TYS65856.1 aminotransferase class I/II-fold pyridoxal phosphate-dependent enzyme [Sutcliffiella horikoshii]
MLDQKKTPLFSGLKSHWEASPLSGHVPGHKFGTVFPEKARDYFNDILKLDVTEITGMDDLHDPEGMIAEAQRLASDLYGSEQTFFLVNGSTVGNLAMILATCRRGSKVLVQRNCHKSILNGLELAGADPVFLPCEVDDNMGVAVSVDLAYLYKALETTEGVTAVVLTNPNYYGVAIDLEDVVKTIHNYNIPVLVDEAHGAHFLLGEPFPNSALSSGADVVVQSAHKTLPAMTMGSWLHVQGKMVGKERIFHYLKMLQSSSPSYPLMASLDIARYHLASMSQQEIETVVEDIKGVRHALKKVREVEVVKPRDNRLLVDPLKLTLRSTNGLSGFELSTLLEKEGLFVELADPKNVLIILPLAVNEKKHDMIERIVRAVSKETEGSLRKEQITLPSFPAEISELSIPFSEQADYQRVKCLIEEAIGEVAAEAIVPYPPGIPLLFNGEKITSSTVEYIKALQQIGARFQTSEAFKSNYIYIYKKIKE